MKWSLFIFFSMFFVGVNSVKANTCSGSGSRTETTGECRYNPATFSTNCYTETWTDSASCGWQGALGCVWKPSASCSCYISNGVCKTFCTTMEFTWFTNGCKVCVTVNGSCGGSNGESFCDSSEITAMCSHGSASWTDQNGSDGVFNWKCNGNCSDGSTANCSATKKDPVAPISGVCKTPPNGANLIDAPILGSLCDSGTESVVSVGTTTYSWTCTGSDGECPTQSHNDANCTAVRERTPVPGTISLTGGDKIHNCEFPNPNFVEVNFMVSDENGINDVAGVYFRFKKGSTEYGSYGPVKPDVTGKVTFPNIDISGYPDGTYIIQAKADDVHEGVSSGWVDLDYIFKKWDCQVIVNGMIYDNSANLSCLNGSNQGFGTLIPADTQEFDLTYGAMSTGDTERKMTVVSPNFNSPDTLTWQNQYFLNYLNTNNEQFLGVFNSTKINDVCLIPHNSYLYPQNHVNAYETNPTINIKYAAIMDQELWFRVINGGIVAGGGVGNYVPVTCKTNCKTSVGGLVWSKDVDLSDYDGSNTDSYKYESDKLPPKKSYYSTLKYDFYTVKEIGTTIPASSKWSEIKNVLGVVFVEGDLDIDENIQPIGNDYVFLVVKGKITIAPEVTRVNGMFYANETISASGTNEAQLKIFGSLYGRQGVVLNRSYSIKRTNNDYPAVEVTYDPSLIFKLPKGMWETYDNWNME